VATAQASPSPIQRADLRKNNENRAQFPLNYQFNEIYQGFMVSNEQ